MRSGWFTSNSCIMFISISQELNIVNNSSVNMFKLKMGSYVLNKIYIFSKLKFLLILN